MPSNLFELQVTLRQHTPIIHFQHHQDGATLRASEVKPKLDRFLIEQMGDNDFDAGLKRAKENNWLIGEGKNGYALNYKMRIIATDSPTPGVITQFPCFFADMGEDWADSPKKFIFHKELLTLLITCFDTDLKDYIDTHKESFFACTNFGMRQTKGFGSFTVDEQTITGAVASFTVTGDKQNNCRTLFSKIDLFYKSLRGGVRNYEGGPPSKFYFKSLIVAYYHKNVTKPAPLWDKEAIKQVLLNRGVSSNNVDVKDLLGLSSTETWGKKTINKEDELPEALVDRFASPILFKPVYDQTNRKWVVYLFIKPIPDIYKNTTITASLESHTVKLKMWNGFDLKTFLINIEKLNDEVEFEQHIDNYYDPTKTQRSLQQFLDHDDCKKLKTIFSTYQIL